MKTCINHAALCPNSGKNHYCNQSMHPLAHRFEGISLMPYNKGVQLDTLTNSVFAAILDPSVSVSIDIFLLL